MTKRIHRAEKAYKNLEFLTSPDARVIRLISEFLEPARRFRHEGIKDTIVFFGSARILPRIEALHHLKEVSKRSLVGRRLSSKVQNELESAKIDLEMSRYYEDAVRLSGLLTKWSKELKQKNRFVMSSGGGPGIMEAANKGAMLAKGRSVGLNISLPFEQSSNPYIPDDLSKAMVVFPGGFGTFDEAFEVLTLIQTRKIKKKVTVVLYGKEYWQKTINFENLVRLKMISPEDLKIFHFADSPEEAYDHIVRELRKNYPAETSK
jgi:uncharacterized protein (TIGR00730 family)